MSDTAPPDFEITFQAMCDGDLATLETLVGQGGFPHGVDGWLGRRWLTNAIDAASVETVEWVLSKGVEVNYVDDEGFSALKSALQVEVDCAYRHPEMTEPSEKAALTIAMIDALCAAGADVNHKMTLDDTVLHVAAAWSSVEVVRHLLKLGADPCAYDAEYTPETPDYYARFHKRWDVHAVLEAARLARQTQSPAADTSGG